MGVISWIVFGLIVGVIAKLLTPGRDPGGFMVNMLVGVAGSLLGGYLGRAVGVYNYNSTGAGLVLSIVGAVILLAIYHLAAGARTRRAV